MAATYLHQPVGASNETVDVKALCGQKEVRRGCLCIHPGLLCFTDIPRKKNQAKPHVCCFPYKEF